MFLATLAQMCARSGMRVHSYVLMSNYYHLLLETPKAKAGADTGAGRRAEESEPAQAVAGLADQEPHGRRIEVSQKNGSERR